MLKTLLSWSWREFPLLSMPMLYLLLLAGLMLACSRDSVPGRVAGYEFFPLEEGYYREYELEETRYALARAPETTTFRIRETIREKYTDATGQDVYRMERALWKNNAWEVDSIWIAWRTTNRAFRAENGRTFVKIAFPVAENASWDGNGFNADEEQTYRLIDLNTQMKVGTEVFNKTLTVVQELDSTLLSLRKSQELYAEGVGLIGSERVYVRYCGTPDCLGKGIIDSGFRQKSSITKFGK